MKTAKKIFTFIYNFVYHLYYIPLLFINFFLNLLLYPIFFCFFEFVKFLILFFYHLTKLRYYFFLTLLNFILFLRFLNIVYNLLTTSNSISYPKLRNLVTKQHNFKSFFNGTNFATTRREENNFNKNYLLKSNRFLYHFDYLQTLVESDDELEVLETDLNIKPQRFYYVNDFYRDEKIYLKLISNLEKSIHEFDIVKNKILLKKILHNIRFQSLTVNPSIKHLFSKNKFPPNRSKLFLKYFNLFNSYTATNIENFYNYQFNHLNVYVRRRAYFLSQDYLNYDWFSYTTYSLKDYLNFPVTEFNLIDENTNTVQFGDHDEIMDTDYSYEHFYKTDYDTFSHSASSNYNLFFNDFIFVTLNYKMKKKFNFITKFRYLVYFYNNYLFYFFKYLTNNFLVLTVAITFLTSAINKLLYKIFKKFYFFVYKPFKLISAYDVQDYPILTTIKVLNLVEFCQKKLKLYYKIVKVSINYFVEWYLCYPLLELNYIYVFVVVKTSTLLIYLYLKIRLAVLNLIKKFKKR